MKKRSFIWLKEFVVKRFDTDPNCLSFSKLMSNKEQVVFQNLIYSYSCLHDLSNNSKTGNQFGLEQKVPFPVLQELNKFSYLLMNKFQMHDSYNLGITFNVIKNDDTEIKYVRCKNGNRPN